ncbi:hypothetical protein EGN72_01975 [Pseudorhodobacter sp. E13]|uniref:transferrin-binding protein-like solute binding protein n=1 Tax=Pseudorhodobacter sp. E13 TaxID=2487931 RepID=UPI000F8F35C6|nr:transferrin-binding protein-like solute binding protein [Pseudorhodobacter sp. E13]RUS65009.1 hypothetical protein EGN72_01975 [Pseudorhodobacter sp. E13]
MTVKTRFLVSAAVLTAVSACGGGGGLGSSGSVQIDPTEEAARSFAQKADGSTQDAAGALNEGATLTARKVGAAGQLLNYANGQTGPTSAEVTIKANAEGGHDITLNGKTLKFTAADRLVEADGTYGYDISRAADDVYSSAFLQTGPLSDLLNPGNGYAEILSIQTNQIASGPDNTTAMAVFGMETRDSDLKALPTATYSGRARLNVVPNTGFVSNQQSRTRVRSDMTMTADFGKGEVSGSLTGITVQAPDASTRTSIAGVLTMDKTTFDKNGFRGSISPDATFANSSGLSNGSGTYSGAFYGPKAEEVAGTLSLTATEEGGGGINGIGYFVGNKD